MKKILFQIRKLDYKPKLYLDESLINQLKDKKRNGDYQSLIELSSPGSEIWKNVDIDQFV